MNKYKDHLLIVPEDDANGCGSFTSSLRDDLTPSLSREDRGRGCLSVPRAQRRGGPTLAPAYVHTPPFQYAQAPSPAIFAGEGRGEVAVGASTQKSRTPERQHALLAHNADEVARLRADVLPFLT